MLNVHPSLLPRWRGAAPIERAIMAGDARTGVCVMQLTAGLDSGPVALREEVADRRRRRLRGALRDAWPALGGELLVAGPRPRRPRASSSSPSRTRRRRPTPRRSTRPSAASTPRARPTELAAHGARPDPARRRLPGDRRRRAARRAPRPRRRRQRQDRRASRPSGGRCCSAAGRGALRLEVVQPPGGKPMPADAYLRGHSLPKL